MKINKMDIYLIFVWMIAIVYTIANIITFYKMGCMFDSNLTICVFAATGLETGATTIIKTFSRQKVNPDVDAEAFGEAGIEET